MDPIYNEPLPIKVAGREFTVRELPLRIVRKYIQQFLRVSMDSLESGITGDSLKALFKDPNPAMRLSALIDPSALLTNYGDLGVQVIADATKSDVAEIEELPSSAALQIAEEVFNIHREVVTRFFHLRAEIEETLAVARQKNGGTPGPSSRPDISPGLSPPASTTEPSGT